MITIAVSGVPGTGKTTLSKKLAKELDFHYIDVNKIIAEYNLSEGYDTKRKTKIVDIKKLNNRLIRDIKNYKKSKKYKGIIIDSHLSHYLPRKYVNLCIVAKCSIKELSKRLRRKRFHTAKIKENLQAEIFDVCLNEARERKHKIIVVDTAKGFNINGLIHKLGG